MGTAIDLPASQFVVHLVCSLSVCLVKKSMSRLSFHLDGCEVKGKVERESVSQTKEGD